MLLLIIIFIALISVFTVSFAVYSKRRELPPARNPRQFDQPPVYRSLFEPTAEEIRASEIEEQRELSAKAAENARQTAEETKAQIYEFQQIWRNSPDKIKTVELLRITAEGKNAEVFSEIAESVIQLWRENQLENLSARDLAQLLDSHFRLLPQVERTSGAIFRLKEEIAELRSRG